MRRFFILLSAIFLVSTYTLSQQIKVTYDTQISLLTCSPGPAGYEKFGHTAFRIYDPAQGIDLAANWGIFDFNQPGFYYKFVRGETYYMLGIYNTYLFLQSYEERNSSVTEQILNLSLQKKEELVTTIFTNYRPENREYLYNFIFDNCATRPYEMLAELYNNSLIDTSGVNQTNTFRDWIRMYAGASSWLMFGIDLAFGRKADMKATQLESLFLPEILAQYLDGIEIKENDNAFIPLVASKNELIKKEEDNSNPNKTKWFYSPMAVMIYLFLFALFFSWFGHQKRGVKAKLDFSIFLVIGMAGLVLTYLTFFSIHPLVNSNLNLLWCSPIALLTAVLSLNRKRNKKLLILLHSTHLLLTLTALAIMFTGVQEMNTAFLPIMAIILTRSIYFLHNNIDKLREGKKPIYTTI